MKRVQSVFALVLVFAMMFSVASCSKRGAIVQTTSEELLDSGSSAASGTAAGSGAAAVKTASGQKTGGTSGAAGTTGGNKYTGPKVTIKLIHWNQAGQVEQMVIDQVVSQFEKENPNIQVNAQIVNTDYEVKLNTMIASGTVPDVFLVPDGDFGTWVKTGVMLDIDSRVRSSKVLNLNDIYPSAWERYQWNGKTMGVGHFYALPKDIGPVCMYYNKDLFKKEGVAFPSATTAMTLPQALAMWQKLSKDTDGDGKIDVYGITRMWWEGVVLSSGGQILSGDHKSFVMGSDQKSISAIQYIADLINKYHVAPDGTTLGSMNEDTMFASGRAACIENLRASVTSYRQYGFNWDVCPVPAGTVNPGENSWSGSVGYAVYSKSQHPDAAYKLVEYFASPEGQNIMVKLGFNVPLYKSQASSPDYLQSGKEPANAAAFTKAAATQPAGLWQLLPNRSWYDMLDQDLDQVWEGKEDAKTCLQSITPSINAAIRNGNSYLFQ